MAKKLYIGNLPYSVDDAALGEAFAQMGSVASARVITDRASGRSKGFGFVEMATDQEAEKAIAEMNGADWGGRPITVSEAKPMAPREGGGGDRGPREGGFRGGRGGGGGRDRG